MTISPRYIQKMFNKLIILALTLTLITSVFAIEDAEQPIKIQANNAKFDNTTGIATYTGNVIVIQGSRHLAADKLLIQRGTDNSIKSITAIGKPAKFHSQPDPTKPIKYGRANTIKYYPQQNKVNLLKNAELTQDGDTIRGPMISYNFATGDLKTKSSTKERTTFTLQPKRES